MQTVTEMISGTEKIIRRKALQYFFVSVAGMGVIYAVILFFFGSVLVSKGGYTIPVTAEGVTMPEIPLSAVLLVVPFVVFRVVQRFQECMGGGEEKNFKHLSTEFLLGILIGLFVATSLIVGDYYEVLQLTFIFGILVRLILSIANVELAEVCELGLLIISLPTFLLLTMPNYKLEAFLLVPSLSVALLCVSCVVSSIPQVMRACVETFFSKEFWFCFWNLRIVSKGSR
jgi:hypothetical protein